MSENKGEGQQPDLREANTIVLFNVIQDNIQFIKRQQWQLVYYTLLLNGALVYIIEKLPRADHQIFMGLTWLISLSSFVLLCRFIADLRYERKRIAPLRKQCFTEEALAILYHGESIEDGIKRESKKLDWLYLVVFGLLYFFTSITVTLFAIDYKPPIHF
jgi:hypothetical protein